MRGAYIERIQKLLKNCQILLWQSVIDGSKAEVPMDIACQKW